MIISQITQKASIWHTSTKKKNQKALALQLAQIQVLRARLIIKLFKATSVQALNVEIYLTLIDFELDKKTNKIIACLCSELLYYTLTQSRFRHFRRIFIPLNVLKKRYAKLFSNNIYKIENKPAFIITFW